MLQQFKASIKNKKEPPAAPPPAANPGAVEAFKRFYEAASLQESLSEFHQLCDLVNLPRGGRFLEFYPLLKASLKNSLPYKYKEIWKILDKKAATKEYKGNCVSQTESNRVLVVGAGPCGLRTAIETQLMGARTVVVERRENFTRNNVLKLWKFLVPDLKSLGAKKFYPKFGTGTINHININTLQLLLAKVCLMLGVSLHAPARFVRIIELLI